MAIIQGNAKQGSTRGFYPKVINGSLRFNPDDTSYLTWTPDSAGSQTTWTFSCWLKKCALNASEAYSIFGTGASNVEDTICYFQPAGESSTFDFIASRDSSTFRGRIHSINSTQFRDASAWYHFVMVWDSTNATSADRVRLYINGVRQTSSTGFTIVEPSQNETTLWNSQRVHYIGKMRDNADNIFDGYLANVHFIDGQALTADDFGETKNGVWVAKDYAGTFGTNGFYLTFEDDTQVEAFNTVLWTGNGGTQNITGFGFKPDLIWIKERNSTSGHVVFDQIRGTNAWLIPNGTDAENSSLTNTVMSFDSDGVTLGGNGATNQSGNTFVGWGWKAGDSNVSNTDGTITSTVRANDTYGFSIVSYTGNGTTNATVGHGLSSAPDFVICKDRDTNTNNNQWHVYHSGAGDQYLYLSDTAGAAGTAAIWPNGQTDTLSVGDGGNYLNTNESGDRYIAYCWSETTGYSKFGSYTGNGSSTGPTVTTGFKPSLVIIKRTDGVGGWYLKDNTRNASGEQTLFLDASDADAEATGAQVTFSDTGFQVTNPDAGTNASGGTYIYAAFADTREAAFWLDQSGNDNDWQPVNLDHNDTVADSPTNNFATLNPLTGGSSTTSNGNLETTIAPINGARVSTFAVNSGKWYCEMTPTTIAGYFVVGIGAPYSKGWNSTQESNAKSIVWASATGTLINTGSWSFSSSTVLTTYTTNDVLGIALDMDSNTIEFFKNGSSVGSATISVDQDVSFLIGNSSGSSNGAGSVNFGQLGFTYTPPTGFNALSTANLPDPVIDPAQGASPEDYFGTALYTGTGSPFSVSLGFQPDLVWQKCRSDTTNHEIVDSVRGYDKYLNSDTTNADATAGDRLASFDADGFSVSTSVAWNTSGRTYATWNWKANGSGVTNTDGSITSTVSANTTSGFSIVSYTGTGSAGTIGHGLSSVPDMAIIKKRTESGDNWSVYHSTLGINQVIQLNTTSASITVANKWSGTTSSVLGLNGASDVNKVSQDYIAYCFHSVEGFSKFGSYVGNGSADGPFVYTGFQVRFLMYKNADATNAWVIYDNDRDPNGNPQSYYLLPNTSDAEGTTPDAVDFLSNGFKIRFANASINTSGQKHIFMAFASNPFKFSTAS